MRVPTVALFALSMSLVAAITSPAAAEACTATAQCLGLGQTLPATAADERAEAQLGGGEWIGTPWQATPFMLRESEPSYSVRTSLAHYFSYREQRKLARDNLLAGDLPAGAAGKTTAVVPPVDVWTAVDFDRQGDDGLLRGTLGADVRLGQRAVVGVALERGELVNGDDERVVTYFKQRIATGFTWSLKGGVGRGVVATDDTAGAVENTYLDAQVARDWQLAGLKLTPSLALQANSGHLDSAAGDAAWTHGAIVVGNRISRSFELGASKRLEPFLAITQSLDPTSGADAGQSLESGLKLEAPSAYTLSATTSVKRSETEDTPALSGRVELKVPLK